MAYRLSKGIARDFLCVLKEIIIAFHLKALGFKYKESNVHAAIDIT